MREAEFGSIADALRDVSHFVEVIPNKNYRTVLGVKKGKKVREKVFDPPWRNVLHPATWMQPARRITKRETAPQGMMQSGQGVLSHDPREPSALHPLGIVAEATGLRRLTHTGGWEMCAPNAVLHPQFGPGVTMATDGVHVILWSFPWPGTEWMLVHRENIWGPVTSTPTAIWEWAGRSAEGDDAGLHRSKKHPLADALAQLEKALRAA